MGAYFDELSKAMRYLAADSRVVFMGQAVAVPGTIMSSTLVDVPLEKRIELPVAEDLQMGMSLGWAINGFIPVSIFPRWNFMLLATGQLINHLDKLKQMSQNEFQYKVIIRVGIGAKKPLNPGVQHLGDFTDAFRLMLTDTDIIRLDETDQIMPAYEKALNREDGKSTIVVEWGDKFAS
jgi:pyruvate/2-oxoglutarate/acetoin dehydrogenase E1 component